MGRCAAREHVQCRWLVLGERWNTDELVKKPTVDEIPTRIAQVQKSAFVVISPHFVWISY